MGVVASGTCENFRQAAERMVRAGGTVEPDPGQQAFCEAKYQVYLQMYADQQRAEALMQDV